MNEREIFTAASQIDDTTLRAKFLDTVSQNDLHLRQRIDNLLKAATSAEKLVDRPVKLLDRIASEFSDDKIDTDVSDTEVSRTLKSEVFGHGSSIGPYRIQQHLGEGGMGVVYAAKQAKPINRTVALKVLRPGDNSRNVLARFEQERHALAMMDHPGIAKILDAGTTADGRPYFAMELVKGISISDYCDRENLSPRERLELFIPVCAAVQHAHQKGVIHRDLKPSNILVALYDGQPIPKVIDFGVAKAIGFRMTEESIYTEIGSIVGTVEYMAPEQAEINNLDIDTRSDIYALGVILYELLVGSPPFTRAELRSAAFDEMLRMIREVEPPKPSTKISSSHEIADIALHRKLEPRQLTRLLSGDLDWVVMKALAKERKRRYQTVGELSADISRYLNCETVEAGPPTLRYKINKFVRRNRTTVTAATLTLLALVGAIVATSYALSIAIRERDAKSIALESERQALKEVSAANDTTLATLRCLTDTVLATHMARQWELTSDDRQFLSEIHRRYSEFVSIDPHSRASRAIRAEGLTRQALIVKLLGDRNAARKGMQDALAGWEELAREFPDEPDWQNEIALCHNQIGNCDLEENQFAEAESHFRKSIETMNSIRTHASEFPNYMYSLADSWHALGVTLYQVKRHDEASTAFAQALETSSQDSADQSNGDRMQSQMASINNSWASQLQSIGQFDRAIESYKTSIELAEKIVDHNTDKPGTALGLAMSHGNLANLLRRSDRLDECEIHLEKSIAILEDIAEAFPVITKFQYHLAYQLKTRARLSSDQNDWASALEMVQRALSISNRLLESSPDDARYLVQAAEIHQMLGQTQKVFPNEGDAANEFQLAIKLLQSLCDKQPDVVDFQVKLAAAENDLGLFQKSQKRFEQAELHLRLAMEIREKLAVNHADDIQLQIDFAGSLCNFGSYLVNLGQPADSTAYFLRSENILKPVVASDSKLAMARKYLRNVYAGQLRACSALGQYASAMVFADKAIALDDGSQKLVYQQMRLKCQAYVQPDDAVANGEQLVDIHSNEPGVLYQVACAFAVASVKTESTQRQDQFGSRAVELLNQCHSLGLFTTPAGRLKLGVPELDSIRQLPEFESLVLGLNDQNPE